MVFGNSSGPIQLINKAGEKDVMMMARIALTIALTGCFLQDRGTQAFNTNNHLSKRYSCYPHLTKTELALPRAKQLQSWGLKVNSLLQRSL